MLFWSLLALAAIIFVIYKSFKDTREVKKEWTEKFDLTFEESNSTEGKYLIVDTETTGLPRNRYDEPENLNNWPYIVQLAWILLDKEGKLVEHKEYILKQNIKIPSRAIEIHGITNTIMEEKGIEPKSVLAELVEATKKTKVLVAHNIDFDVPILEAEFLRNGFEKQLEKMSRICTMKIGKNFCKLRSTNGKYRYPTLMELFKKCFYDRPVSFQPLYDKHNALTDVALTAKCFLKLKEVGKIKR
jgi:DNA polymerase III epsilon subunit-like protein